MNRRAAPRSAVHAHRAPVPLDDRRDDRQPQARSPRLAVAGGVRPIEAPEDLLHILVGDSRTVVAHLDDGDGPGVLAGGRRGMRGGTPPRRCPARRRRVHRRSLGAHANGDLHRGILGGVPQDVAQQVRQHLGEPVLIADDDDRGGLLAGCRRIVVERDQCAVALRGEDHHVGQGARGDRRQVDLLHGHLPALIHAGELKKIIDEAPHARGLGLDAPHDLVIPLGRHAPHAVELAVAADRGQGGAQLVRGVGDEAGHALLSDQLDVECLLVALKHDVERPLEGTHLGGGRLGVGHARRQVPRGDSARHAFDLAQGAEGSAHEVGRRGRAQDDHRDIGEGHHETGLLHGLHDVLQRQADRNDAGELALRRDRQGDHAPLLSGQAGGGGEDLLVLRLLQGERAQHGGAVLPGRLVGDHLARRAVEVLRLDVVGRRQLLAVAGADLAQALTPDRPGRGLQLLVDLGHQVGGEQRGDR